MTRLTTLLLLLPAISPAFAAQARQLPLSRWSFRLDGGTQSYQSLDLRGKFFVDEDWFVSGALRRSRSEGTGHAGEARAAVGARVLPVLQLRGGGYFGQEPNSIQAWGVTGGVDWTANPRGDGEHETVISLDFTASTYAQKGANAGGSRRLSRRFLERTWVLSVDQEVSADFSVNAFYSTSRYPNIDGDLGNSATDRRRRFSVLGGAGAQTEGLPDYSFGAGIFYAFTEYWDLSLDYARARVTYTLAQSDSLSPSLGWEFDESWILGLHANYLRQDLADTAYSAGLSLTHEF